MEPLALRISEAARCCGVSRYVIYDLINAGKIPVIKREGADMRVLAKDIEEFLLKHRVVLTPRGHRTSAPVRRRGAQG